MINVSGELLGRSSSSRLQAKDRLGWKEAALLVGLGASVVVLHAVGRWPIRLTGHNGVVWMALLIIGRVTSRYRWAATVSSAGACALSAVPIWGFNAPLEWLIYLLPGPVMDLGYTFGKRWQNNVWFLGLLGSAAHCTKLFAHVAINLVTGLPYKSLLYGIAYPLAMYIMFGAVGAMLAAKLVLTLKRRRKVTT